MYEPNNCRWATTVQQNRNKRTHLYVDFEGQCRMLADVVDQLKLNYPLVYGRLKMGWDLNEAPN